MIFDIGRYLIQTEMHRKYISPIFEATRMRDFLQVDSERDPPRRDPPNEPTKPPVKPPDKSRKSPIKEPPDPRDPPRRKHPPIGDPPHHRESKTLQRDSVRRFSLESNFRITSSLCFKRDARVKSWVANLHGQTDWHIRCCLFKKSAEKKGGAKWQNRLTNQGNLTSPD